MLRIKNCRNNERGSTLVEFSIGVTVFLTAMFGVMEFGRALWVHNALTDAYWDRAVWMRCETARMDAYARRAGMGQWRRDAARS